MPSLWRRMIGNRTVAVPITEIAATISQQAPRSTCVSGPEPTMYLGSWSTEW